MRGKRKNPIIQKNRHAHAKDLLLHCCLQEVSYWTNSSVGKDIFGSGTFWKLLFTFFLGDFFQGRWQYLQGRGGPYWYRSFRAVRLHSPSLLKAESREKHHIYSLICPWGWGLRLFRCGARICISAISPATQVLSLVEKTDLKASHMKWNECSF